jgi:hypothetical protein
LRETRRTPRPAAGCNKPANFSAEKTVEVVRNHEGGTRQDGWCRRPEGSIRATGRFWEVDAQRSCRWRGGQVTKPQERQGPRRPVGASALVGTAARGPATVRTLRRRRKRSGSADDGWLAIPKRRPGAVLEGPGPVTVEGRGGRREEPTDLHTETIAVRRGARRASQRLPTPASLGAALQAS